MISHHIDPDGDVILTLHNPNQAFAVWHPSGDASTSDGSSISDGSSSTGNPSIESTFIEVTDDRDAVRFQLSSKHLTLASNYFKNTLTGPWKESIKKGGQRDLNDYDWSEKALLIVLNIIHGRNRDVPNRVSRHLMTEIAAITDYYQCHEAIELWYKDVWWDNNRNPWDPQNYGSDLIKRLFVAWVFYEKTVFRKLTRRIAIESQGPIQTRNLVFPIDVISTTTYSKLPVCVFD